ncbi:unnamed protein product [Meganyctiphanes norvegica]|uniref:Uncharacterized protein n=1 Tax=Meganyctiphanes norvegica TaxID=48144 RepID=A0AAV2QDD1_MEGNR
MTTLSEYTKRNTRMPTRRSTKLAVAPIAESIRESSLVNHRLQLLQPKDCLSAPWSFAPLLVLPHYLLSLPKRLLLLRKVHPAGSAPSDRKTSLFPLRKVSARSF